MWLLEAGGVSRAPFVRLSISVNVVQIFGWALNCGDVFKCSAVSFHLRTITFIRSFFNNKQRTTVELHELTNEERNS